MPERHELRRAGRAFHSPYCTGISPRSRDTEGADLSRAYLAGPPYADEYRRRAATLLAEAGWEAIDPMRRDFRGRTVGHEVEIVESDLAEIRSCDALLASFTAADEGSAMEAWYAHTLGKPVIAYTGGTPPHPWTVYVAHAVCAELEDAVRALTATRAR